jgi:hypothetical protein
MKLLILLLSIISYKAKCQSTILPKIQIQFNSSNFTLPFHYISILPTKQLGISAYFHLNNTYVIGCSASIWNPDTYLGVSDDAGYINYNGINGDYAKTKNKIISKTTMSFFDLEIGTKSIINKFLGFTVVDPSICYGKISSLDSIVKSTIPPYFSPEIYNSTKKELLLGIAIKQSFLHEIKNTNFMYGLHIGVRDYFKYYTDVQIELGLSIAYKKRAPDNNYISK